MAILDLESADSHLLESASNLLLEELVPAVLVTDTFTRANSDTVGNDSNGNAWVERSGDWDISSNGVIQTDAGSVPGCLLCGTDMADGTHWVEAELAVSDGSGQIGLLVRLDAAVFTGLSFEVADGFYKLLEVSGGEPSTVFTGSAHDHATGEVYAAEIDAAGNVKLYLDGTQVASTTSSFNAGDTRVGLHLNESSSGAVRWDNFRAGVGAYPGPAASIPSGSVTGGVAAAGSAAGSATHTGATTGAVTASGSSTGARSPAGAVVGTVTAVGSATGVQPVAGPNAGSVTGTVTAAGTATGSISVAGATTGAVAAAGTATGAHVSAGTTSGAVTMAGSATGGHVSSGAVTGAVTAVGSSTGTAPTVGVNDGSVTGIVSLTGSVTGQRFPVGSATGVVAAVGAATGGRVSAGAATGVITAAGAATGFSGELPIPSGHPLSVTVGTHKAMIPAGRNVVEAR